MAYFNFCAFYHGNKCKVDNYLMNFLGQYSINASLFIIFINRYVNDTRSLDTVSFFTLLETVLMLLMSLVRYCRKYFINGLH